MGGGVSDVVEVPHPRRVVRLGDRHDLPTQRHVEDPAVEPVRDRVEQQPRVGDEVRGRPRGEEGAQRERPGDRRRPLPDPAHVVDELDLVAVADRQAHVRRREREAVLVHVVLVAQRAGQRRARGDGEQRARRRGVAGNGAAPGRRGLWCPPERDLDRRTADGRRGMDRSRVHRAGQSDAGAVRRQRGHLRYSRCGLRRSERGRSHSHPRCGHCKQGHGDPKREESFHRPPLSFRNERTVSHGFCGIVHTAE